MSYLKRTLSVLSVVLVLVVTPAFVVAETNEPDGRTPPDDPVLCLTPAGDVTRTEMRLSCVVGGPAEVQGYDITCASATYLDVLVADCCIPGDHWSLKGKDWDLYPNTAVTTAPGGAKAWSAPARVYNYGGTSWAPGLLNAYFECSYLHGVNVFPAGAYVYFRSDGVCTVSMDPIRSRIDRMP